MMNKRDVQKDTTDAVQNPHMIQDIDKRMMDLCY